jgi:hypothetical protein
MHTLRHPRLTTDDLATAITRLLTAQACSWSVGELYQALLEHYAVDFGEVISTVVSMSLQGQLQPRASVPSQARLR